MTAGSEMPRGRRPRPWGTCAAIALLPLLLGACARGRLSLPADPGEPFPDFAATHAQVAAACSGVRTLTAELGLSGRVGGERIRGRVIAGFERPASMRLEGTAPFGPPAFILVSRQSTATLLMPRDDDRVVRGARAEDMLGALTGVTLAPADLHAILTGCVSPEPRPVSGRLHANGWGAIVLADGATVYLRQVGGSWQVRAARRGDWQVEYPTWQGRFPASIRLQTQLPVPVDLAATISQLETNTDLDASAFTLAVPNDAQVLTLDELRQSGPLRDR